MADESQQQPFKRSKTMLPPSPAEAEAQAIASPAPLEEDWKQDMAVLNKPKADPKLAGLYRVLHTTLWFSVDKQAAVGRIVRLSADDAMAFLQDDRVVRVGD